MTELLESTWIYIKDLGAEHNVNPILFGLLYVASIPPYLGSMGWIVRNYRKHKPLALPIISTLFFFILPASYIAIFGKDVAWWVYAIIAFLLIYGGSTALKTVKKRISQVAE
jgi:O-antigen/teichoic acid export membrane protein